MSNYHERISGEKLKEKIEYWLIADTHFGHANIQKYCGRAEGFEEIIFENLEVIRREDLLIHLGDICIGKELQWHRRLYQELDCRRWLVKGNHDNKNDIWYLEHGWDFVGYSFSIKRFGKKIFFSHELTKDMGYDLNIHGHSHGAEERYPDELARNSKQYSLSIEKDLKPVNLRNLVEKLSNGSNVYKR